MTGNEYTRLIELANLIENNIAALADPGGLLPAYKVARLALDPLIRRAWADVAPAAALRRFGDCKEVNALQALAADDLAKLPEHTQPLAGEAIYTGCVIIRSELPTPKDG